MAILFQIVAECGPGLPVAQSLLKSFTGLEWVLSDGTVVRSENFGQSVWKDDRNNWFGVITPFAQASFGISSPLPFALRSELIQHLHEALLRMHGFRFADIGWEIVGDVTYEKLLNREVELPRGIILSSATWAAVGYPSELRPNGGGYYCRPLSGNDYQKIARLWHAEE
jgi:hypothetical protein